MSRGQQLRVRRVDGLRQHLEVRQHPRLTDETEIQILVVTENGHAQANVATQDQHADGVQNFVTAKILGDLYPGHVSADKIQTEVRRSPTADGRRDGQRETSTERRGVQARADQLRPHHRHRPGLRCGVL